MGLNLISSNRECQAMASVATDLEKQYSTNVHFRGGVNMGIGSFNLVSAPESLLLFRNATPE